MSGNVIHTTKEIKVEHPLDRKLLVVVEQSLSSFGEKLSSRHYADLLETCGKVTISGQASKLNSIKIKLFIKEQCPMTLSQPPKKYLNRLIWI